MAHTPTPWKVNNKAFGDTDMVGAEVEIRSKWGLVAKASAIHEGMVIAGANARFIVQAVNSYDDLLAACEATQEWFIKIGAKELQANVVFTRINNAIIKAKKGEDR